MFQKWFLHTNEINAFQKSNYTNIEFYTHIFIYKHIYIYIYIYIYMCVCVCLYPNAPSGVNTAAPC